MNEAEIENNEAAVEPEDNNEEDVEQQNRLNTGFDLPVGPIPYHRIVLSDGTRSIELTTPASFDLGRLIDLAGYSLLLSSDDDFKKRFKKHMLQYSKLGGVE